MSAPAMPPALASPLSTDRVTLSFLGPSRGYGLVAARALACGEELFAECPLALFQPNRPLVPTCWNQRCARVVGAIGDLVEKGHDMYVQATGQPVRHQTPDASVRAERTQLLQRMLVDLPPTDALATCRCGAVYCCSACAEESLSHGHALLCPIALPGVGAFLESRNVIRNADAQVAARIMARFVMEVGTAAASTVASASESDASQLQQQRAAALWSELTHFHAHPWSTVLAAQAIDPDMAVLQEHHRSLAEKDREAQVPTTINVAAAATAAAAGPAATPLTSTQTAQLHSLQSAQSQYRAALAEGFSALRQAWSSSSSSSPHLVDVFASRSLWLPYVTLEQFDRLAGANRLNCTLTQAALPIPTIVEPKWTTSEQKESEDADDEEDDQEKPNMLTATEESVAAAASASSASSTSGASSSSSPPFLVSSLLSLFSPMSLPLASAKGLFLLHSKMNHACSTGGGDGGGSSNARVENVGDGSGGPIDWSTRTQALVSAREQQRQADEEKMHHGNKKKKQKMRKKAEARAAQQERREREEMEALRKLAAATEATKQPSTTGVTTAAAATTPHLPLAATCRIIVRSTRAIAPGEEILINYLPTNQPELRGRDARRAYLRKHYLFECRCATCEPTTTAMEEKK